MSQAAESSVSNGEAKVDNLISGIGEKLSEFCGYTTAHGFGRLVESVNFMRKVFWVLACVGAMSMFSYQGILLLSEFTRKPVQTSIFIKHVKDVVFPAVTICNHNVVRLSHTDGIRQQLKPFLRETGIADSSVDGNETSSRLNHSPAAAEPTIGTDAFLLSHSKDAGNEKNIGQGKESKVKANVVSIEPTITRTSLVGNSTTDATSLLNDMSATNGLPSTSPLESFAHWMPLVNSATPGRISINTSVNPAPVTLNPRSVRILSENFNVSYENVENSALASQQTEVRDRATASETVSLPPTDKPTKNTKGNQEEANEDEDDSDFATDFDGPPLPSELDEQVARRDKFMVALGMASDESLQKIGHQFKDLVRKCTYRGKPCKKILWSQFWHYMYGNCFVFNRNTNRAMKTSGTGPSNGLVLELNVEQDEYIGDLSPDAGVRVYVGSQGEMPFPYEKGFSISPGFSTSAGLRKVMITRADPFRNKSCMASDDISSNVFKMKFEDISYSTTACRESCLAQQQRKACACQEYRFPVDTSKKESVCDVLNSTVVQCLSKVMRKYKRNSLGCNLRCPSPCKEEIFKLTLSSSKFPSRHYRDSLMKNPKALKKARIPVEDIRDFLLQLNVFYKELNYESIEESESYGLVSFLSDIGGQMGMWVGISILTCAELVELLGIILHQLMKRLSRGRNTSPA